MSKITLSIIIPHYNSPRSLEHLISSIGVHDGVEVIVVDDRSNKNLAEYQELKERYSHNNVSFYDNNSDTKGAGTSRNIGLQYARGTWILFADADDYFDIDWFESVKKYFDSEYDLVYFTPASINLDTGLESNRHLPYKTFVEKYECNDRRSNVQIRYYWPVPWSKLIKKKMIVDNQIKFEEVRYSNDVMFSVLVGYYADLIAVEDSVIYWVTDQENTLTKNVTEDAFFTRCEVMCRRFAFLKTHLGKEEREYIDYREGTRRLLDVIKRRYGVKSFVKCFRMLRKSGYPLYARRR